jgi:thiosulfate sulfurtransferase
METLNQIGQPELDAIILNSTDQVSSVDAGQLDDWITDGDVFLADLRDPEEFEAARISGAFLVSFSRLHVASFPRVSHLKTVLVCQNGFLAPIVRDDLINAGFENVYALEGGLGGWIAAGLEVDD